MASWDDLANEFTRAARGNLAAGLWRSCLNRVYYAMFARLAGVLQRRGVTMPAGWEGPQHEKVYNGTLIYNHLRELSIPERSRLAHLVLRLYDLRRTSDYCPSVEISQSDARQGFGLLVQAIGIMEKST